MKLARFASPFVHLRDLIVCLAASLLLCGLTSSAPAQTLAFPGAVGFGAYAAGGRGGTVCRVTTQADSGAGSFRDAVSQPNRIVIFDVGGYITLSSEVSVKSRITIAGQTAPGGGIAIRGDEVSFGNQSNIICRFVRFRPGSGSGTTDNGVNFYQANNIIMDHVSIEFAKYNNIDGATEDWQAHPVKDITVQNCLIADPIGQQFGAHTECPSGTWSWFYNVFANAHGRQPLAKINTVFINNVVYNYEYAYACGNSSTAFSHDVVSNYFITGPATDTAANDFYQIGSNQSLYESGNLRDSNLNGVLDGFATFSGEGTALGSPWSPLTATIPTVSPAAAFRRNVSLAGAWPRDQVDYLVLKEVLSVGTAGPNPLPSSQTVTGLGNNGFGTINGGITPLDTDQDGMPDYWEMAIGLNPAVNDSMVVGADGYANIENYLNWLAEPHAFTSTNGVIEVDLWPYTVGFTNALPVYFVENPTNGTVNLTNSHFARFTPDTNFAGLGGFRFSVLCSDGLRFTNGVVVLVSSLPPPSNLIWRGDGTADLWAVDSGSNWFNGTDLVTFTSGDNVTFDDSGSNTPPVNLVGSISAGTVSVLAEQDYTFGGSGALVGPTALFKVGAGKLTLNTLNTFTGGTIINEGIVQLGDGVSVNGSLSGNVTNNDTLIFANPTAVSSAASISGSGTLIKQGNGALSLSGTQSYTNLTTIEAGTLEFTGTPPPGVISNNAVLTFKPAGAMTYAGTITGPGRVNTSGYAVTTTLSGTNTFSGGITITTGNLQLANSFAAGTGPVTNESSGLIYVGNGAVITNDHTLTMSTTDLGMRCDSGTGTWAGNVTVLSGASWRPGSDGGTFVFTGTANQGGNNFIVPRGSVHFASNAVVTSTGSATALGRDTSGGKRSLNLTIKDNASLTLGPCSIGGNRDGSYVTVTLQDDAMLTMPANSLDLHNITRSTSVSTLRLNGGTLTVAGFTKTQTYTNIINFNGGLLVSAAGNAAFLPAFSYQTVNVQAGGARINDGGFSITITQPLTHDAALGGTPDGGLTKLGTGTLTLAGANTFTGPTTILGGTLALSGSGSIASSSDIHIAAGAVLDASAVGNIVLGSGRSLSGNGSVSGGFFLSSGATVAPGSNAVGRLTFGGTTVFAAGSTSVFEISKSPLTNDVAAVPGSLTLNGTLAVTQIDAAELAAGDSFKLFDAGSLAGSFANVQLPALNAGLAWNTNDLATAGTISVISTAPLLIRNAYLSGGDFVMSGGGGAPYADYYVLTSTNVALPLANWERLSTNQFDGAGNFTNTLTPDEPQRFYRLQVPAP